MKHHIIVSNRMPISFSMKDGKMVATPSQGGLATGLRGLHAKSKGLWVGWPGGVEGLSQSQKTELEHKLEELGAAPVYLTEEELDGYYRAFSNGVLWPLFHYQIERIPYHQQHWEMFYAVNRRFADTVCDHYRPGDLIWIHDYQLALVPQMIRERIPEASIGFFLHVPFPTVEVFRLLPWRDQILQGILGADIIGFHTFSYVRQFINSLIHALGLMPSADRMVFQGRSIRFWAYPMGVDAKVFDRLAREEKAIEDAKKYRQENNDHRILLGIDRLDYTKGIPRRLLAIEKLLERESKFRGSLRYVQISVPSRVDVPQYEVFAGEVQQLVGRINGRFSTPSSVPIHFIHRGFTQPELVGLYLAADAMLVTPLRDGMNLVAKEFVASRADEDGVLVLSEFAGAASEMGEAVLVNPYDIDGTADAIARALEMPRRERQARIRALRERVFRNDVHRWAENFMDDLGKKPRMVHDISPSPVLAHDEFLAAIRNASNVAWLLDYDGTLAPFARRPELAEPDEELRQILATVAQLPGMRVDIVSGRQRDLLAEWMKGLPVGLHSEHGLWSWCRGASEWSMNVQVDSAWKDSVRPILEEFATRTPGTLVEEKTASLAWHYRMADAEYGEWQARELKIHLTHALSNMAVEILPGNKVIEVKPHGVNKGMVVPSLLADEEEAIMVAIGDDETDEYLFRALPENAFSICVGTRKSSAQYSLPDVRAVRKLLLKVIEEAKARHQALAQ